MNFIKKFPPQIICKIEKIKSLLAPHTNRAYLVGGCVRDLFMDNAISDIDVEVYDLSEKRFQNLMEKLGASGVGKSFFVYKLDGVDFSLPRSEKKVGVGHKAFEVEIVKSEKLASKRRDFTMNALMINIFTGELLDFWGGVDSIYTKELRLIDENSFKEDSLRVLRAVQFCARFDLDVQSATKRVMKEISLQDLSSSRIFWELEKLFLATHLSKGFLVANELGVFEKLFDSEISMEAFDELCVVEKNFEKDMQAYYFLYIVANFSNKSVYEFAKTIDAPKHYLRVYRYQPFFKKIPSDKKLLEIAAELPISKWLGNYKPKVKLRAKELGIWENVFAGGVKIEDILKDGFRGKDIKIEYKKRVLNEINRRVDG